MKQQRSESKEVKENTEKQDQDHQDQQQNHFGKLGPAAPRRAQVPTGKGKVYDKDSYSLIPYQQKVQR